LRARKKDLPPAIIIGGGANSISAARSLGLNGIKVYALSAPGDHIRYSRFSRWIPAAGGASLKESWERFLIGAESDHLRGAVLIAAGDAGIEIIAAHRERLSTRFILDISNREAQLAMLDKLATYRLAIKAGVNTPRFWPAPAREDLLGLREELVFPLLVKPLSSIEFGSRFPSKHFVADDFSQLLALYDKASQAEVGVFLVEQIPGPDDRLCSYYTYIDEQGEPAFHFTKRIIRRFPINMGLATYHVTDCNAEVREQALKLFKAAGLKGVANAEFKRDERDGQLKLIECNARITASNGLVAESGFDIALFVYHRLIGEPYRLPQEYKAGKRLWYPVRDFRAFCALRKNKEMTFGGWARSILHRQSLPYFKWHDPAPSIIVGAREMRDLLSRRFTRARQSLQGRVTRAVQRSSDL
jgi:predicted ATP-grasp superfamily ATP-dependent carboligase